MKLFDILFGRAIDRRIAVYQNDLIAKHCEEVQNVYRTMRGWRHDYHNHIQAMLALTDKPQQLRAYLLKLNSDLTTVDTVIKTGNVMVDAILNSKLSLIQSHQINLHAKAVVPSDLKISEIDLCIVIGNLLDNAMEAALEAEQPQMGLNIIQNKAGVAITISNSFLDNGAVPHKKKKKGVSTKAGHQGIGLSNAQKIIGSYDNVLSETTMQGGCFVQHMELAVGKE